MTDIVLIRHAESYANLGDFAAFGNQDSPLTDAGIAQCGTLAREIQRHLGIIPENYPWRVGVSEYRRAQQTAQITGFGGLHVLSLINESDPSVMDALDAKPIELHAANGWVPEETLVRAAAFVTQVQEGKLRHQLYFTHGLFIAGVLTVCKMLDLFNYHFDPERGYVPFRAHYVKISV